MRFLNCRIDVSKGVFRPRPETVFWTERVVSELRKRNKELKILDIFSGSGCIGIAVLKNVKTAQIDFIDVWRPAIEQIKINLELNKIPKERYELFQSDLFQKIEGKKYDYILANPPYVALDRIGQVQAEVLKNDPALALFAGKDGMMVIERFLNEAKKHLNPGGKIFMEFDPLQKIKIENILKIKELKVKFRKDQFGKIRWIEVIY